MPIDHFESQQQRLSPRNQSDSRSPQVENGADEARDETVNVGDIRLVAILTVDICPNGELPLGDFLDIREFERKVEIQVEKLKQMKIEVKSGILKRKSSTVAMVAEKTIEENAESKR